jgi:tRNA (cmo5U34)-methyltransferase
MTRDRIFEDQAARGSDFVFDDAVAMAFDDMVARSVPLYAEQQRMIAEIAATFWLPRTSIYDLGCATATTLVGLGGAVPAADRLVGYDSSTAMLAEGRRKVHASGLDDRIALRHGDLNGDLAALELRNASVVLMCWTLQFIRPLHRDRLIAWIYEGLVDHGALVVTEKVLTNASDMNRFFIEFYYAFKRRNGYSGHEILRKREALENVLVPYRAEENHELFRRNGFAIVETFFQWYGFSGYLCVKKPSY